MEALVSLLALLILISGVVGIVRIIGWTYRSLFGPTKPAPPTWQDSFAEIREEVEGLTQRGVLDRQAHDKLMEAIRIEETRLLKQRLARKAAIAPEMKIPMSAVEPAVPLATAKKVAAASTAKPAELQTEVPPAPLSLPERAAQYAASRVAASAELEQADASAISTESPREPAVPFSRLLAAFMEEKNIRWGELVGGLLIVGCSIALVISFWAEIAARPWLKFGLFNGVTAALFGVGLYTERRWKIHNTSHGLLVIATLLVPLNFLAIAAFTQDAPSTDLLSLVGEGLSLAVFATLVYFAGLTLVPEDASLLTAGVMLPSLMQLLVRRFAEPGAPLAWIYGLAGVSIVGYLATTGGAMWRLWGQSSRHTPCAVAESVHAPSTTDETLVTNGDPSQLLNFADGTRSVPATETAANQVLVLLGLVSAAALLPLALLAYKVPPLDTTLHWLSPLVAPCGLPALLVGLWFWRSVTDRQLSGLQTAGIGVGALGALVMVGAVVLAWPDPATLLPTALLTAAVLTAVALLFRIPAAHVPAGVALAAAGLIGFHLARGNVGWTLDSYRPMKDALISALSGQALVPMVGAFGGLAWWLAGIGRREDGKMYSLVAAATAVASLALVLWFGFARAGDPANATWTLAVYAAAAIVAATKFDRAEVAWAAAVLLLTTILQGVVYRYAAAWELQRPWITAILAYGSLCAIAGAVIDWLKTEPHHLRRALEWSGLAATIVAAALIVAWAHTSSAESLAVNLAWLAGVCLALAALADWPALFTASQVAVVAAILCAVTAAVEGRAWYAEARHPWLDPWFLQAQGIALAGYCLVCAAVRWVVELYTKPQAAWVGVERVVEGVIVASLLAVAIYAALPGVAQELAPLAAARGAGPAVRVVTPIEQYEVASIAHAHAGDWGAWALLAAVAAAVAIGVHQTASVSRLQALLLTASAVCPLLSFHWEADVAVASALRWLLAGFFAVLSVPIWLLQRTALAEPVAHNTAGPAMPKSHFMPAPLARAARNILVAIIVLAYLAMGAYVFASALARFGVSPSVGWLCPYLLCWALAAGVAALLIPRAAGGRLATALHARDVLLLLAVGPIAILVTFAVAMALDQHPIVGPELTSWFRRIGWDWCYGVPLATIAAVFVGYAARDRSSRFAFAAGILMNVVATLALLVRLARGGGTLDATAWVTVAQVNAIVAGGVALAWLAAIWGWARAARSEERETGSESLASRPSPLAPHWPWLLITQAALAAALCGTFLLPSALGIAVEPVRAGWVPQASFWLGWVAVALATIAACWINWRRGVSLNGVALFAATLVATCALTATHWDMGNWLAFHTLLVGCCLSAWVVPLLVAPANQWLGSGNFARPAVKWSAPAVRIFGVVAVVLALRAIDFDPGKPWWTVTALGAIGARNVWIAWHERSRGVVWIAAPLVLTAASYWWVDRVFGLAGMTGDTIVWVNVVACALLGVISVWIERTRILPVAEGTAERLGSWRGIAFHRFASWAIVSVMLCVTIAGLADDLTGYASPANWPLAWAAWAAALVAAVACWWDPATRWPIACLYCVGLLGVGMFLHMLHFQMPMFQWALALALAAYSLATSSLWSVRERLRAVAAKFGAPVAVPQGVGKLEGDGHGWLVGANFLIGVGVLTLVWWIEISIDQFDRRMVAAYAIGAQAFALALLARGAVRTPLQYVSLVWGVLFAVAFGWAWLPPDFDWPWLHRLIVTVAALAVAVVVYGFGLVKFLRRENEWTRAAGRLVPLLAGLAAVLFVAVLCIEVTAFAQGRELHVAWPALVAVALALLGLAVAALAAALLPGRDPLGLSERGRTTYVYTAEGLAALLFLHIRVTMPWLFHGWFVRYWSIIVMVIAFVGVGLGEWFGRRQQRVLAEPLQSTGALLPLLPAIGFWFMSSQMFHTNYSLILLSIGVLYAALSVLRQSFWFAVLAALAANGSLWFLLYETKGLGLFEHPQLWLIPPALAALAAGHINRERLSREQATALRYAAAIVIYVSSTADVFINGVAEAPWLPAVLAGLSILGVLAGILLRIQSFIYLGMTFLVVALMTIIWHAAQGRTWIWWVAGIITGGIILALLGLFEKRRDDVLRFVEKMKHWEA